MAETNEDPKTDPKADPKADDAAKAKTAKTAKAAKAKADAKAKAKAEAEQPFVDEDDVDDSQPDDPDDDDERRLDWVQVSPIQLPRTFDDDGQPSLTGKHEKNVKVHPKNPPESVPAWAWARVTSAERKRWRDVGAIERRQAPDDDL